MVMVRSVGGCGADAVVAVVVGAVVTNVVATIYAAFLFFWLFSPHCLQLLISPLLHMPPQWRSR